MVSKRAVAWARKFQGQTAYCPHCVRDRRLKAVNGQVHCASCGYRVYNNPYAEISLGSTVDMIAHSDAVEGVWELKHMGET